MHRPSQLIRGRWFCPLLTRESVTTDMKQSITQYSPSE